MLQYNINFQVLQYFFLKLTVPQSHPYDILTVFIFKQVNLFVRDKMLTVEKIKVVCRYFEQVINKYAEGSDLV